MRHAMNRKGRKGLKAMTSPYKKYLLCFMFAEVAISMVNGKGLHLRFIPRPISSSSPAILSAFLPTSYGERIKRQGCHHRSPITSLPFINERNKGVLNQSSALFLKNNGKDCDDNKKLLIDKLPMKIIGNTNAKKKKKDYNDPKSLGDMIPLKIKGVTYSGMETKNNGKDSKPLQDMIPIKTKGNANTMKKNRKKKYGNDSKSILDMIPITSKEDSIITRKKNRNNNERRPISKIKTNPEKDDDAFENYVNNKLDLQLVLIDNYDSYTYNLYSYLCTMCKYKPIVISNDAYDSWDDLVRDFTYLKQLSEGSVVGDNDQYHYDSIKHKIDGIIISPGPGRPECEKDMGICLDTIAKNSDIPILGVCLGHQALGHYYNASVSLAPCGPMHGLTSKVWYTNQEQSDDDIKTLQAPNQEQSPRFNLFHGISQLFDAVRYHSLVVEFPKITNDNNGSDAMMQSLDIEPIAWCHGNPTDTSVNVTSTNAYVNDESSVCMALQHKFYPHYGVQFHPESIGTGEVGYKILENFCQFCAEWQSFYNPGINDNVKEINNKQDNNNIKKDTNVYESSNSPISTSNSTTSPKYKISITKIDIGDSNDVLPVPEQIFEHFFATSDASFWLDSSTGRRDADVESTVKESTDNDNGQCPIVANSRFSIMGDNNGPLCRRIEYWGQDHPLPKRGVFVYDNDDDGSNGRKAHDDLLPYLNEDITSHGMLDDIYSIELESNGNYVESIIDDVSEIPFEFRGGYVGYIGYELRHDTRTALCRQEICNVNEKKGVKSHDEGDISNEKVPTAAFLFADRSLVYDHWRGEWYAVGIAQTHQHIQNVGEWIETITKQMKEVHSVDADVPTNEDSSPNLLEPIEFSLERPKEEYKRDIARCHEEIRNGESYELCLTNQLKAKVSLPKKKNLESTPFGLYKHLRRKNPAPFSGFVNFSDENKHGNNDKASVSICCSSPERFLSITKQRAKSDDNSEQNNHGWEFVPPFISSKSSKDLIFFVETKPIKGTAKREIMNSSDENIDILMKQDAQTAEELRTSVKNRAENLMIVDLLRNDLSRVCQPGSVHVPKLMAIESFATVHQLVSTIRGVVNPNETPVDVISSCFPGGSMTGAPKLRSIDILNEMELDKSRGPYSGCMGYISLNGCMDLNIIIRTAILTPRNVSAENSNSNDWEISIGAGGAITALSESQEEFDEMILKSKAITDAVQHWYSVTTKPDPT